MAWQRPIDPKAEELWAENTELNAEQIAAKKRERETTTTFRIHRKRKFKMDFFVEKKNRLDTESCLGEIGRCSWLAMLLLALELSPFSPPFLGQISWAEKQMKYGERKLSFSSCSLSGFSIARRNREHTFWPKFELCLYSTIDFHLSNSFSGGWMEEMSINGRERETLTWNIYFSSILGFVTALLSSVIMTKRFISFHFLENNNTVH